MTPFLAIDWGTTNRRVFQIDAGGAVVRTERDDRGVLAMRGQDYAAAVSDIRARFGEIPVLCAGMVGSNIGWRPAPYVSTPGGIDALAAGALKAAADVWIVPGMSHIDVARGDVMRGEEVQLLGAVAAGLVPPDALLCQPGTHCKWVTMRCGQVAAFTTAMTGEVFALLKGHGLLAAELTAPVVDGAAFREGVEDARDGDLLARLFGIRAASVLGLRPVEDHAAYASGLLIGSDVAARLAHVDDARVFILSDPALGALYATAIRAHWRQAIVIESHDAFVAGVTRIWSLIE